MGLTRLKLTVKRSPTSRMAEEVTFLIDSGAVHSVVPREVLRRLGIKPFKKTSFTLANGESISRGVGGAFFAYKGNEGVAPVVFGEKGDSALLGATTLEAMELALNPLTRDLYPLQMTLDEQCIAVGSRARRHRFGSQPAGARVDRIGDGRSESGRGKGFPRRTERARILVPAKPRGR